MFSCQGQQAFQTLDGQKIAPYPLKRDRLQNYEGIVTADDPLSTQCDKAGIVITHKKFLLRRAWEQSKSQQREDREELPNVTENQTGRNKILG